MMDVNEFSYLLTMYEGKVQLQLQCNPRFLTALFIRASPLSANFFSLYFFWMGGQTLRKIWLNHSYICHWKKTARKVFISCVPVPISWYDNSGSNWSFPNGKWQCLSSHVDSIVSGKLLSVTLFLLFCFHLTRDVKNSRM